MLNAKSTIIAASLTLNAITAVSSAQNFNANMQTDSDTPRDYKGSGSWNMAAPVGQQNFQTGFVAIPGLNPPPQGGAYWSFSVGGFSAAFNNNEVVEPRVLLQGTHIRCPLPGHNEGQNDLPPIRTSGWIRINGTPLRIPANVDSPNNTWLADTCGWGGVSHMNHYDVYAVRAAYTKYEVIGQNGNLRGFAIARAYHQEDKEPPESFRRGVSLRAPLRRDRSGVGSTVSFDATTGKLSFSPGPITVLDRQGALSDGVDPAYANDGMLESVMTISDLTLQGVAADGRYRFSGGSLDITDPIRDVALRASFDEFLIGDTSKNVALDSFGLLTGGETVQSLQNANDTAPSPWMSDFVNDHLMGDQASLEGYPEHWIDLSFITETNLASLTNGFTTSALNVPADIYVGGNGGLGIPEPSSAAVMVVSAIVALCRRRPHH